MPRPARLLASLLALGLLAAACGSDDDDSSSDATTSTTEAEATTTTTVVTTTVDWNFEGSVSETDADQAASTMERRLIKFYELSGESSTGTAVVVDDAGTGLAITVPTESADAANELVAGLSFRGDLYFRPTNEGWAAPADSTTTTEGALGGEASLASYRTQDTTTTTAGDTTTTTSGSEDDETTSPAPTPEATDAPDITSPDDDDPEGTSVLPWRDYTAVEQLRDPDSAEILSIWEVGPAALSGTAVEDSEVTTLNGANAVKVVLAEGADGLDAFNAMAESCFNGDDGCAGGAYGVALDSQLVVVSVVRPNASSFTPFGQDDVIIWGEDMTEDVAITLAVAFEAGALPTSLSPA
jgi:hypothetical protein